MKNKNRSSFLFLITVFISLSVSLFFPKLVFAQCTGPPCYGPTNCNIPFCRSACDFCQPTEDITGKITNPLLPDSLKTLPGVNFFQKFLITAVSFIFVVGSIIFFFMLATGGLRWITSSGDKTKLDSAQKQITSALTGLVILFLTFAIIKLIETLFGISILKFSLPTLE